jgi:hypothetical protein
MTLPMTRCSMLSMAFTPFFIVGRSLENFRGPFNLIPVWPKANEISIQNKN